MKKLFLWAVCTALALPCFGQITNLEFRVGGDLWRLGYTASSSQINCGLCPQIIDRQPGAQSIIADLQDSVMTVGYHRAGLTFSLGASIGWPGLRAEIQVGPSMRKLDAGSDQMGRYANRNISAFVGVNPMQFDNFAGKYYLGEQQYYLDLSDAGIYAQWSFDGGFEEFVRSTNNLALLARWQPTVWLTDQQRFGISLRGGARLWVLGNGKAEGPFITPTGLPKKVRPEADWFLGIAVKVVPF